MEQLCYHATRKRKTSKHLGTPQPKSKKTENYTVRKIFKIQRYQGRLFVLVCFKEEPAKTWQPIENFFEIDATTQDVIINKKLLEFYARSSEPNMNKFFPHTLVGTNLTEFLLSFGIQRPQRPKPKRRIKSMKTRTMDIPTHGEDDLLTDAMVDDLINYDPLELLKRVVQDELCSQTQ